MGLDEAGQETLLRVRRPVSCSRHAQGAQRRGEALQGEGVRGGDAGAGLTQGLLAWLGDAEVNTRGPGVCAQTQADRGHRGLGDGRAQEGGGAPLPGCGGVHVVQSRAELAPDGALGGAAQSVPGLS